MDSQIPTEQFRRLVAVNDLGFCLELATTGPNLVYLNPIRPTVKSVLTEDQLTNGFPSIVAALDAVDASQRANGRETLIERYNAYLHQMSVSESAITG